MLKLYIIGDGENIKIGISKQPEKRLKQLQTGHPLKLSLLFVKESKNARRIEKFLHDRLRQFKTKFKTEWFKLPEINWLIEYIETIA
jgi:hypothetical protein